MKKILAKMNNKCVSSNKIEDNCNKLSSTEGLGSCMNKKKMRNQIKRQERVAWNQWCQDASKPHDTEDF